MTDRRLRCYQVSEEFLESFFRAIRVVPEDAKIIRLQQDPCRRIINVVVESERFDPVPEYGEMRTEVIP